MALNMSNGTNLPGVINVGQNYTKLIANSMAIRIARFPGDICWLLLGIPGAFLSALTVILIAKSKKMRSGFYFCVLNVGLSDLIFSLSLTGGGAKRLIYYLAGWPEITEPVGCFAELSFIELGANAMPYQTFSLALERFIAVAFPIFYKKNQDRPVVALAICSSGWALAILDVAFYLGAHQQVQLLPACSKASFANSYISNIFSDIVTLIAVLIIVCYLLVFAVIYMRLRRARKEGKNITEESKKLDLKVTVTALFMSAVYLVSLFSADILQSLLTSVAAFQAVATTAFAFQPLIFTIAVMSNFIFNVSRLPPFRAELLKMLQVKQRSAVQSINIPPSTNAKI